MARLAIRFFLMFSVASGFLTLSSQGGEIIIPPGNCAFAIFKLTPQFEGSIPFEFIQSVNGVETQITVNSNFVGPPDFIFVDQGDTVSFTELPQEGWTLEEIDCFEGVGVEITKSEDSVTFECVNPVGELSGAFCGFFNRVSADKIPTLSEWGMISAAAGLGLIGVFFAVRRRRAINS
ncbi:MAG: IPTL-CTERM sorting domain-containing protein [Thermodesulfobacteriota bacterium]